MTTLADRLGYAADAKLLIIHLDDFGMCHSENVATQDALLNGSASSASIMAPCPWRDEAIAIACAHPDLDIGMHATVNSEWDVYRWGPVAGADHVPSLVDEDGYLWKNEEAFVAHADPADVERELRAQYALLTGRGVDVTHLDMHMQSLASGSAFFDVYVALAQEFRVPFMFPDPTQGLRYIFDPDYERISRATEEALQAKGLFVLDRLYMETGTTLGPARKTYYLDLLADLEPGLRQIIMHVAQDDPEIRALAWANDAEQFTYRMGDYAAVMDADLGAALATHDITLIGWRQVRDVLYG